MTLRSALKFEQIFTLILRIDLEYGAAKIPGRRKKIVAAIHSDWEACEAKVRDNKMSFRWDGSGDPGGYLSNDCQASRWRHNIVVPFYAEDGAIFVQVGSRASKTGHDVRLIFDHFSKFEDEKPEHLFRLGGRAYGIDSWRVTVEAMHSTFSLNGLSLDDVNVDLPGYPDRAIGKVLAGDGTICGYEAGRRVDEAWWAPTTQANQEYKVKNRYGWEQERELAIRNRRPVEGELPAIQFDYRLPGPVTLLELQESVNPLAGAELTYKDGTAERRMVECWKPKWAWAKIFSELRQKFIGEEPTVRLPS